MLTVPRFPRPRHCPAIWPFIQMILMWGIVVGQRKDGKLLVCHCSSGRIVWW